MLSGISVYDDDLLCFFMVLLCCILLSLQKGQLGHGDKVQRDRPTFVSELSKCVVLPSFTSLFKLKFCILRIV